MDPSRMDRRAFVGTAVSALASLQGNAGTSRAPHPNVVLIMADDLGFECLECNGGTSYRTPNLNRLADSGVRFSNCHSTPLCTPSRVQLMTGKYNFRNYREFGCLPRGEITIAHTLSQAGYRTAVVGKWQLAGHYPGSNYRGEGTLPDEAGFHEHCLWQVTDRGSRYWNPMIQENGVVRTMTGRYGPDVFCDYLLRFFERHRTDPFFAYFPMALTHDPFQPTPDSGKSEQARENDASNPEYFGDMVQYMDKLVGQITSKLTELGIRDRTLVLFTADNGTHSRISSNLDGRPVRGGKGLMTDAGTRVPLIASWPDTQSANVVCPDLVDFTDFLPTLLETAGLDRPETQMDGRSFLPQVKGQVGNPRDWIFCHYDPRWGQRRSGRFARDLRWKLYGDDRFYDLAADPAEERSIARRDLPRDVAAAFDKLSEVLARMR